MFSSETTGVEGLANAKIYQFCWGGILLFIDLMSLSAASSWAAVLPVS